MEAPAPFWPRRVSLLTAALLAAAWLILLWLGEPPVADSAGQPSASTTEQPAAQAGAPSADLLLLLDRSGSMRQFDPDNLSLTGAGLLVAMLDPSDRLGLIPFDEGARLLLPLTRLGDGQAARSALARIGPAAGQWTDIRAALEAAGQELDRAGAAGRRQAVLLFTDGYAETGPDGVPPGYMEELFTLVDRLAARGAPVYTVGLGDADHALLGQIAARTGAEAFAAASAPEVVTFFAQVLSSIKERQVLLADEQVLVPGAQPAPQPAGAGALERSLVIPAHTRLLTLSATGSGRLTLEGQMPGGGLLQRSAGLRVARGDGYLVYSLPRPVPGLWQIRLQGEGRVQLYVQVESALRLHLQSPAPFSRVQGGTELEVTVAVEGLDNPAGLSLWAQDGSSQAVGLQQQGQLFTGPIQVRDGRLQVWAVQGETELTRREFRLYPTPQSGGTGPAGGGAGGGEGGPSPVLTRLLTGLAGALLSIGALLGAGALNWRRLRRREERVTGRLGETELRSGTPSLALGARSGPAGPGSPAGAIGPAGPDQALAWLEARLVPLCWPPLSWLGLGGRQLQLFIRPAPGCRVCINGRPPGDGRLYHGDQVQVAGQSLSYWNPKLGRRPAAAHPRRAPARTRRLK